MNQGAFSDAKLDGKCMSLRLDHRSQSELLRALVEPWVVMFVVTSGHDTDHSYIESTAECGTVIWNSLNWSTDTWVRVTLRRDGPSVSEVRWLLSRFDDCGVGTKTLQLHCVYESSEMDCVLVKELTCRPSKKTIDLSRASLQRFLCRRKLELEIATVGLSRLVGDY
jgi:hypothetical protein